MRGMDEMLVAVQSLCGDTVSGSPMSHPFARSEESDGQRERKRQ